MKKELWDEEHIESLFKHAPKVEDHRTKEQIFERLQAEGLFEDLPKKKEITSKGIRWMPLIASIASLFIIVIFAMQLFGNSSQDELSTSFEMEKQSKESKEDTSTADSRIAQTNEEASMLTMDNMTLQSLVYPSQLENTTLFTIGLAGDDAQSVPVSFLIPNDVVEEKLGTTTPTKLQLYEAFAPLIDEQALGFNEYHPLQGKLIEQNSKLIHQVSPNTPYDLGSAALSNYIGTLIDTFGDSYQEVLVQDEQGNAAQFEQVGELSQPISLTGNQTQYNYFSYQKRDGSIYLSPNFRMSYLSVDEALKNMTTEANDIYQTVILPDVTFQSQVTDNVVTVTFNQKLQLDAYDSLQATRMIEGILLTAASFNLQVQFKNIEPQQWSGFDFTKPLEQPLAANRMYYDFP
jgi:hypothetical protein